MTEGTMTCRACGGPMTRREGRLTLGLWNSYDRTRFAEAHRRALARVGAVAAAFDCNLVTFGFPYDHLEEREGLDLRDPQAVAERIGSSTTIGEGGRYFGELAAARRFHIEDLPAKGLPPQYGRPVLATSRVPPGESTSGRALAERLYHGESLLLVIGLGPHGFPRSLEKIVNDRWELTGRGMSLETCTAMSAAPAILSTHLEWLRAANNVAAGEDRH